MASIGPALDVPEGRPNRRFIAVATLVAVAVILAVAALLIGIADTACKYWIPEFGAFLVYAATIALLLWRPMGLFGTRA